MIIIEPNLQGSSRGSISHFDADIRSNLDGVFRSSGFYDQYIFMFHAEKTMFHANESSRNDVSGKLIMSTALNTAYMNGG